MLAPTTTKMVLAEATSEADAVALRVCSIPAFCSTRSMASVSPPCPAEVTSTGPEILGSSPETKVGFSLLVFGAPSAAGAASTEAASEEETAGAASEEADAAEDAGAEDTGALDPQPESAERTVKAARREAIHFILFILHLPFYLDKIAYF